MKKVLTTLTVLIIYAGAFSQAPQKMSYQAIVINSSNVPVASKVIGMQISILQGSATGLSVYTETQTPTTDAKGLVTIEIGSGIVVSSGVFASINWATGPYFVKTEIDPTGGTAYSITGTSQLLSVPYALYAETSGTSPKGTSVGDIQYWNGTSWTLIPIGKPNDVLKVTASKIPAWTGIINPSLITLPVTSASYVSAICGGEVSDGGNTITERGVCWSILSNPTILDTNNKTKNGIGAGSFISSLTGLIPNTNYFVRAYIITNNGNTFYGNQVNFKTLDGVTKPLITTTQVTSISNNSALIGVEVINNGGASILEKGVWLDDTKYIIYDDGDIGSFTKNISSLTLDRTYRVTAYAINGAGTSYGKDFFFKTTTLPTIITLEATSTSYTSVTSGGKIIGEGGSRLVNSGICWSTSPNPKTTDNKIYGTGNYFGSFSSLITGLTPNTIYYLRAFAVNMLGVAYGNEVHFVTTPLPILTTTLISSISNTSAISGGDIITKENNLNAKGVCWSSSPNPTIANNRTTDGLDTGSFVSSVTGLMPNTTYYLRAYATNSQGTGYGDQLSFTTGPILSELTTTNVSSLTSTSSVSGGYVTKDGGANVIARGVCWSTSTNPTIANNKTTNGVGIGSFTSSITGLLSSTDYYLRAYATNSVGTSYGSEVNFTTLTALPILTSTAIYSLTASTAKSGGNISWQGTTTITARGVCWSTSPNPTIANSKTVNGSGTGIFASSVTGLVSGTIYYLRAYATNSAGTAYGNEIRFGKVEIGNSYQGGIIGYILQAEDPGYNIDVPHGLIVTQNDLGLTTQWSNDNLLTGAVATSFGTGNTNTNIIVSAQGAGSYAAKLCYDVVLNGYSDWYLPSKEELKKIYLNQNSILGFSGDYWSSTEYDNNNALGQSNSLPKNSELKVRAVRTF